MAIVLQITRLGPLGLPARYAHLNQAVAVGACAADLSAVAPSVSAGAVSVAVGACAADLSAVAPVAVPGAVGVTAGVATVVLTAATVGVDSPVVVPVPAATATWGAVAPSIRQVSVWVAHRASDATRQHEVTSGRLLVSYDTTRRETATSLHWPGAD